MAAQEILARIENRLDERAYFTSFSGEPAYPVAEPEAEPPAVALFTGLPPTTVDAIARHLIGILEAEGYIRKQARPTPATLTRGALGVTREVPTPAPRPVMESPASIVNALAGERVYLRSIWYDPTMNLRERWEGIVDDGEGKYTNVKVWIWPEDKQQFTNAGYSVRMFEKTVTRRMLEEAIPVTIKWSNNGAKLDSVLPRVEVNRRIAS